VLSRRRLTPHSLTHALRVVSCRVVSWCAADPIRILVKRDELTLEGIKQFFVAVEKEEWKFGTALCLCLCLAFVLCMQMVLIVVW
jgi:hypothetical protein